VGWPKKPKGVDTEKEKFSRSSGGKTKSRRAGGGGRGTDPSAFRRKHLKTDGAGKGKCEESWGGAPKTLKGSLQIQPRKMMIIQCERAGPRTSWREAYLGLRGYFFTR